MPKIMMDTNGFDFMYNNNLIDLVKELINCNQIAIYITHVQKDQINAINDNNKKQIILSIPVTKVLLASGWAASDDENGGFKGPRVDDFRVVDDHHAEIMEECLEGKTKRTQRIFGDMGIVYTAIQEKMDYLVSGDRDVKQFYECMKNKIDNNLNFFTLDDFSRFLKQLQNKNKPRN